MTGRKATKKMSHERNKKAQKENSGNGGPIKKNTFIICVPEREKENGQMDRANI